MADGVKLAAKTVKRSGWEQLGIDVPDRKLSGHCLELSQMEAS